MKRFISIAMSFIMITAIFTGCGNSVSEAQKTISASTDTISAVYPIDTTVDFHTKKQSSYLSKSSFSTPVYITGKSDNSKPEPITFEWADNEDSENKEYILSISEAENMENSVTYTTSSNSIDIYNLKLDTTYYWCITDGENTSKVTQFETDGTSPRNINVDGVTNVRDLGGRVTENGTKTKQGLIYRCGRLNESSAETPTIEITSNGILTMKNQLGVKAEIDLRKVSDGETGAITSSPLGEDVLYFSCPMEWEGNIFEDNREQILKVFEILSDENNYPLIFHCNIGTDRTGMIAFLVNALLGVPEDELFRDYMFSNFGNIGGTRKLSQLKSSGYYEAVTNAQGTTLSEKTYNTLADLGVPEEQLDSIISILS